MYYSPIPSVFFLPITWFSSPGFHVFPLSNFPFPFSSPHFELSPLLHLHLPLPYLCIVTIHPLCLFPLPSPFFHCPSILIPYSTCPVLFLFLSPFFHRLTFPFSFSFLIILVFPWPLYSFQSLSLPFPFCLPPFPSFNFPSVLVLLLSSLLPTFPSHCPIVSLLFPLTFLFFSSLHNQYYSFQLLTSPNHSCFLPFVLLKLSLMVFLFPLPSPDIKHLCIPYSFPFKSLSFHFFCILRFPFIKSIPALDHIISPSLPFPSLPFPSLPC